MRFDSSRDFKAVLFPPVMILFFLGGFGLPMWILLYFLATPNVAWLAVATAVAYFLNYEWLHWAYHCDPDSRVGRLPGVQLLRKLHRDHHNQALMTRYNFNITYPIGDWLFGTRYKARAE
jgi:sterol desaturase/sphingolipid hydroxylase (fatty acid hydroxylase superfamily)